MAHPSNPAPVEIARDLRRIVWRLDYIIALLTRVLSLEGIQMASLAELRAEVEETKTVQASAVVLLQGLKAKLDEAIANGNMAEVEALTAELDATTNALASAVAANPVP